MSEAPIIIVNDQLSNSVSAQDRGLFYGDGVFETMRFEHGDVALWQYHYERMVEGLQRLGIVLDKALFKQHVSLLLSEIDSKDFGLVSGIIKLVVTRGQGGRGYMPAHNMSATLVSYFYPLSDEKCEEMNTFQKQGVQVTCCETVLPSNPLLAGLKTLNQLPYVIAAKELAEKNVQDGLLFTGKHHLIESLSRNIFIVKKGELYTPDLSDVGVAGTMRRFIIESIAPALGLVVNQLSLRKENLFAADEVFLVNSVSQLWPVIACDEIQWQKGKITRLVQTEIEQQFGLDLSCSLKNNFYE